jgi:magnesium chelatase subunit I
MERRAVLTGEKKVYPRICDLAALVPAVSGKIELVYEGEQEGPTQVAKRLIGQAVNKLFTDHFPAAHKEKKRKEAAPMTLDTPYKEILGWFSEGNSILVSDEMPASEYLAALDKVRGLKEIAKKFFPAGNPEEQGLVMELILEGLHQNATLAKENLESRTSYRDMLETMLRGIGETIGGKD